ncbi:hypothetical protein NW759_016153 [Fusarium solani]|nr:hypothetical protein NW759_016153 [Fusarium solani]
MEDMYIWAEVKKHSTADDLYLVIKNKVYDVTKFQHEHPGGGEFILDQGGTDVTELFEDAEHSDEARSILKTLQIGTIKTVPKLPATKKPTPSVDSGHVDDQMVNLRIAVLVLGALLCMTLVLYPNLGLGTA